MWVLLQVVVCPGHEDPGVFYKIVFVRVTNISVLRKYPGVFDKLPFLPDQKSGFFFTICNFSG